MSPALHLLTHERSLEVRRSERTLFCYVFEPETPVNESRRPYVHPLYSVDGDVLTNLRPNDHPWHHGLSLTLTRVDGINFWGGPSFRAEDRYLWRADHGVQAHAGWIRQEPEHLEHWVEWKNPRSGETLLRERRALQTTASDEEWTLRWMSELLNVSGRPLVCDNYHSAGALVGSHYTGLQFRGARGLLDEHGDDTIGVLGDGGAIGANAHALPSRWIEWHTQHDTSLRRTRIRFEAGAAPLPWFLRPALPLIAFAPHAEKSLIIAASEALSLDHRIRFARHST